MAEKAAAVISGDPRVRLVYLFGSAADPSVERARDVDLAIYSEPALSLEEIVRLRADVVDVVDAEVDLISLNDAPVVLAKEVADRGECLYADPADVENEFVVRARSAYWDFKPFLDAQWENTGARLRERVGGSSS